MRRRSTTKVKFVRVLTSKTVFGPYVLPAMRRVAWKVACLELAGVSGKKTMLKAMHWNKTSNVRSNMMVDIVGGYINAIKVLRVLSLILALRLLPFDFSLPLPRY